LVLKVLLLVPALLKVGLREFALSLQLVHFLEGAQRLVELLLGLRKGSLEVETVLFCNCSHLVKVIELSDVGYDQWLDLPAHNLKELVPHSVTVDPEKVGQSIASDMLVEMLVFVDKVRLGNVTDLEHIKPLLKALGSDPLHPPCLSQVKHLQSHFLQHREQLIVPAYLL
jgi:hypothetical protein